ncbi:hypothetical protein FGD71_004530 [Streptomyces sporangiiformans]|uniref:Uncharacterized protein n=1 Tax=Streptomyces sporangiiformans TaxID=2315329 RepID=A0A505DQ70_9ACTN|nr:hypothetical protein FGD71_004530 [Streptomyces sporangiiformans]
MFSRNRDNTHESGTARRNKPDRSQRPRCVFFKGTSPSQKIGRDGVSTYLALIFGTLLSSQGTDASFVLTLAGFPLGASLRCFSTLSGFSWALPFGVSQLYQGFPVSLTTVLRARRTGPEIGSDKLGAARQGRLVASPRLKQVYDPTWRGGAGANRLCCALRSPTGNSRAEPSLFMTYPAQRCAVRDKHRRPI